MMIVGLSTATSAITEETGTLREGARYLMANEIAAESKKIFRIVMSLSVMSSS
jgi:hypothetical protein